MKGTDNKLSLVKIKFSLENYKELTKKEISQLSDSAKDLFHFMEEFGNLHNIKDFVSVYMHEDLIQNIESDNCGPFQLYFNKNIFGASMESDIINHERLTKNTVETLLNELSSLEIDSNEKIIERFIRTENIKFGEM